MKRNKQKGNPFHAGPQKNPPAEVVEYPIRLNKYIAKCGICSRRKAAELVKKGEIEVNGQTTVEPFVMVSRGDTVTYQGETLKPEQRLVYLLLNKPKNYITTTSDEKDRRTVLDLIKSDNDIRLFPVGRLDRNTTGLLLITNDGDMAKKLSHPSHKVQKEYVAVLDRDVSPEDMEAIRKGLMLDDGPAPVIAVNWIHEESKNKVILSIEMGRNRIVRRIFERLNYEVLALDRTYYAGLTLKKVARGTYRNLTNREIIMLKHFT